MGERELYLNRVIGVWDKDLILLETEYSAFLRCRVETSEEESSGVHLFSFIIKTRSHYHFPGGSSLVDLDSHSYLKVIELSRKSENFWAQLVTSDDFLSEADGVEILDRKRDPRGAEKLVIKYRIRNHYLLSEIMETTKRNVKSIFQRVQEKFEEYIREPAGIRG